MRRGVSGKHCRTKWRQLLRDRLRDQGNRCIVTKDSAKKRQQFKMNAPIIPNGTHIKIIARNRLILIG